MLSRKFIVAILLVISVLLSSVSLASAQTSSPKPDYWRYLSEEAYLAEQDFFAPSTLPAPEVTSSNAGIALLQNNNLNVPPQGIKVLWNPFTKWCFPVNGGGGSWRYTNTPEKAARFYGGFFCTMANPGFAKP